ncbi:MAG: 3-oxoacyl-ACP reductase FabG [Thiohalomonadales bacterium]
MQNDIALVTGASRGIGKAIALALGAKGGLVVGTATSEKGAQAISESLQEASVRGAGMVLDVTSQESVNELIKTVKDRFGAISILVNSAGITQDNLLMRMKDEQWNDVIDTNLSSVYRLSKACLRDMTKARSGRIINISSVVGVSGNGGQTNYAASKAGMIGFSKSLAREVGSRGITVNSVAPGFIDTDMTRALSEDQRSGLLRQIPLARLGQPTEIAAAVVFLASVDAAYISGETINVNGGMYMN